MTFGQPIISIISTNEVSVKQILDKHLLIIGKPRKLLIEGNL